MSGNNRAPNDPSDRNTGWVIISYLVAGMAIYGGLGWLVGQLLGTASAAPLIGMLVGLTLAIALVVLRYGRP